MTSRARVFAVVEGILLLFCREMSAEYNAAFARVARLFREAKEAQAATDLDVVDSVRVRLDTLAITFADRPTESAPRLETGRQIIYQLARLARFACEINTFDYLPLILTSARRMREDFGVVDPTEPVTPEQLRAFEDRWHPTPNPIDPGPAPFTGEGIYRLFDGQAESEES